MSNIKTRSKTDEVISKLKNLENPSNKDILDAILANRETMSSQYNELKSSIDSVKEENMVTKEKIGQVEKNVEGLSCDVVNIQREVNYLRQKDL